MSLNLYLARLRNLDIPEGQKRLIARMKHYKDRIVYFNSLPTPSSKDIMERNLINKSIMEFFPKIKEEYQKYIDLDVFS